MAKIRLFIAEKNLDLRQKVKVSDTDFEYLTKVMRQKSGDKVFLFNGINGEFEALIIQVEKKFLFAEIVKKISDLKKVPNITLAFALIKNVRIDFIAAKATELGVQAFQPILTNHTIIDKINLERFKANVKEACEQCERNDFPQIFEVKKLEKFLSEVTSSEKIFILCDESGQAAKASEVLKKIDVQEKEIVILIGPEGGFSENEFAKMRQLKNLFAIALGPRILRADTAMISALTLVQEFLGDFNLKPKFVN
ncbi:MAG: 16S rRNA (uracil(1498)-N(3))-methyltransferase [Proteobacteria bacterium]|nr:16S rRNA (uracil(1498)-N(3))-methyltransferase [Pseudomonadota bacterium]